MSKPEDKKTQKRRLRHEEEDLHKAILAVALNWGTLEEDMARLLQQLIGENPFSPMGFYIYFSPDNAATRFDIVASAFESNLGDLFDSALADKAREQWAVFFNALGRGRRARNDVTHGVVRTIEVGRSKRPIMRLAPSGSDPHRWPKQPNQVVGRSPEEVEAVADRLRDLRLWSRSFKGFARAYHGGPKAPTLPAALAALEDDRQRYGGRIGDDQTPQGPVIPFPTSRR